MMAKRIFVVGAIIVLILVMAIVALAHVPQLISFQGKLYGNAGDPLTGEYEITFRIFDVEQGGKALWIETDSVHCEEGLYTIILGLISPINLNFDGQYWLSVQVTGDDELSPRYRLVSVPTALRAEVANQVSWTSLTDVPEGFADGTDDIGEDGGISQINAGIGITVTDPTGPTVTVAAEIGPGAEQVASGDHSHDDDYVNEGQVNSITNSMILNEAVTSPKIVIPLILRKSVDSPYSIISCINDSETGFGVYGRNDDSGNYGYLGSQYYGLAGISESGTSVYGSSTTGNGVYGRSNSGFGVKGYNRSSENEGYIGGTDYAVYGQHSSNNYGYLGSSNYGVYGQSDKVGGYGVLGVAHSGQSARGVIGVSNNGIGVEGNGHGTGVYGYAGRDGGSGVYGICGGEDGTGVWGSGDIGVKGTSTNGTGVHGYSFNANAGVFENENTSNASSTLYAITHGPGCAVHGRCTHSNGRAGYFQGHVAVTGKASIGTSDPGSHGLVVASSGGGYAGSTVHIENDNAVSGIALTLENESSDVTFLVTQQGSGDLLRCDSYTGGWHPVFIIENDGAVGIGTTSPGYTLHVIGDIAYTGNIYDVSDIRLKENITPLEEAVEKVSSIRSIYFNNKGESPDKREVGVIAQEVERVLPEVVSEDAEGYKSVDYSKLTPLLIEAVKEQQAQIEILKSEIADLKAKIK